MSWDVLVLDFQGEKVTIDQLIGGYKPSEIGTWKEIKTKLTAFLPEIEWPPPGWQGPGLYRENGVWIEFNEPSEEPIDNFLVGVRTGEGGDPIPVLTALARQYGWSLLDMSTGDFLDLESPSFDGWQGFKGYCSRPLRPRSDVTDV